MLSSVSWKRQKATEIVDYGLPQENVEAEGGSEWVNLLCWYSTISVSTGHGESSISYGKSDTEQIQKHLLKQKETAREVLWILENRPAWKADTEKHALNVRWRHLFQQGLCREGCNSYLLSLCIPRAFGQRCYFSTCSLWIASISCLWACKLFNFSFYLFPCAVFLGMVPQSRRSHKVVNISCAQFKHLSKFTLAQLDRRQRVTGHRHSPWVLRNLP